MLFQRSNLPHDTAWTSTHIEIPAQRPVLTSEIEITIKLKIVPESFESVSEMLDEIQEIKDDLEDHGDLVSFEVSNFPSKFELN